MSNYTALDGFLGHYPTEEVLVSHSEWVCLARDIRSRLGDQAHLLDEYLRHVFTGMRSELIAAAQAEGYRCAAMLRSVCVAAVNGTAPPDMVASEYYSTVKDHMDSYPKGCPKEIRAELSFMELLPAFIPHAVDRYRHRVAGDLLQNHTRDIFHLTNRIQELLRDSELLLNLNDALERRFQLAIPMESFIQGIDHALLDALLAQDDTGRCAYQHLL